MQVDFGIDFRKEGGRILNLFSTYSGYDYEKELQKPESSSGTINIHCPFHNDRHPSAWFNVRTGFFGCHSCGIYYRWSDLVQMENDFYGVASRYGEPKDNREKGQRLFELVWGTSIEEQEKKMMKMRRPSPELCQYFEDFVEASQRRLREIVESGEIPPYLQEYLSSHDLQIETLVKCGCGYRDWTKVGPAVVFPMIKSGICVGVGLRGEEGKRNLPNSNVWPIGLDDAIRAGAPVVAIAEGGSDYLRLSQAVEKCGLDTPVIGWPGNVVPEEWESYLLNFDRIIFYRQGDKTSELISKRVRDRLGERVRVVTLPTQVKLTEEIVVSPTNKDICEWCKDMQYWKENYGTTDYDIDERLVKFLRNVPQPRRIVYTLEDMIHPPKTAGWLIENAIPRGEIGLLWGPSQNGKTTLALNLIYSLATGEPLAGIEGLRPASDLPRPLKVLFIEEDASLPNEIIPRLRSIFTGNPSPSDEDFGAVVQRVTAGNVDVRVAQLSLRVDDENSPGYRYATELLEEFWPHVVIYDALRSIHSKEENSPSEMAIVINNLRTLQAYGDNRTDIILHHTRKPSAGTDWLDELSTLSGIRGTTALVAASRFQIGIYGPQTTGDPLGYFTIGISGNLVKQTGRKPYYCIRSESGRLIYDKQETEKRWEESENASKKTRELQERYRKIVEVLEEAVEPLTWDELGAKLQVKGITASRDTLQKDILVLNEQWEKTNAGKEIVVDEGRGRGKKTTVYLRKDIHINNVRR